MVGSIRTPQVKPSSDPHQQPESPLTIDDNEYFNCPYGLNEKDVCIDKESLIVVLDDQNLDIKDRAPAGYEHILDGQAMLQNEIWSQQIEEEKKKLRTAAKKLKKAKQTQQKLEKGEKLHNLEQQIIESLPDRER